MKLAVIPGDGTGPEVVAEGLKVLDAVRDFDVEVETFDLSGARYLRDGAVLPDDDLERLRKVDAIYLGAVGHPDVPPGIIERGLLLRLRFELDQYVNLRPVVRYPGIETLVPSHSPETVDFVVVRENSEGLYSGVGGFHRKDTPQEVAVQSSVNTRHGVERIVRYAFELARSRRKHLTLVHKTNVLTFAGDLYQRVVNEVAADYPDVDTAYTHVDACCIYFLDSPQRFDVIVTDNMFGDIITDLGAMIQGGMGVAAGGNINPDPGGVSMFEPIGGTAPTEVGKGTINPIAAIGAMQMLLEHTGHPVAAASVDRGIRHAVSQMPSMAAGRMGRSTAEVGDLTVEGART